MTEPELNCVQDGEKPNVDVVKIMEQDGELGPSACCVRSGWARTLGVLSFDIRTAKWEGLSGEGALCRGHGHALLRMPDVKVCAGFGDELDRYYTTLALNRPYTIEIPHKLGMPPWEQYVRVALWVEVSFMAALGAELTASQDGLPPEVHHVYTDEAHGLGVVDIPELASSLKPSLKDAHYDVWDVSNTGWRRHSLWRPQTFDGATTLLLKLVHVKITPELGQLIATMYDETLNNDGSPEVSLSLYHSVSQYSDFSPAGLHDPRRCSALVRRRPRRC